jgi:8-oxo-dGTP diphosphatase
MKWDVQHHADDVPLMRIVHDPIQTDALVVERRAVRALISQGSRYLLFHSQVGGDVKFPGGGVQPGEDPDEALIREVLEECGRRVVGISPAVLRVVEVRAAREAGQMFASSSTYHPCVIDSWVGGLRLDDYERDLGFTPIWMELDAAIGINDEVLAGGSAQTWVARETHVMRWLRGTAPAHDPTR